MKGFCKWNDFFFLTRTFSIHWWPVNTDFDIPLRQTLLKIRNFLENLFLNDIFEFWLVDTRRKIFLPFYGLILRFYSYILSKTCTDFEIDHFIYLYKYRDETSSPVQSQSYQYSKNVVALHCIKPTTTWYMTKKGDILLVAIEVTIKCNQWNVSTCFCYCTANFGHVWWGGMNHRNISMDEPI